jgi:nucleoside-diphosphate-sugar epimerase
MKVALIGGAGFIGHHLAVAMKKAGMEVIVIDNLKFNNLLDGRVPNHLHYMLRDRQVILRSAGLEVWQGDAREPYDMWTVLAEERPDVIVHLAGMAHIDRSENLPSEALGATFDSLANVLATADEMMRNEYPLKHVIFFSSSTVYGDFKSDTVTEEDACEPKGFYASHKYAGELLVRAYGRRWNKETRRCRWSIIRPCALYGPRCVSGRVTQRFMELAHDGLPIELHGDPQGKHDFTYIDDLIDGVMRIVKTPIDSDGEIFNITAGKAHSMQELVDIIRAEYPDLKIIPRPADPDKPARGTLSVDKARRLLGYEPKWNLTAGMGKYMTWYRDYCRRKDAINADSRTDPQTIGGTGAPKVAAASH